MVLEDWEGLVNILKLVKNKFKSTEEMKNRATLAAKQRPNKQLALPISQPVYSKQKM